MEIKFGIRLYAVCLLDTDFTLLPRKWKQKVLPKCSYLFIILQSVMFQKTVGVSSFVIAITITQFHRVLNEVKFND
jgi:hypothetical protein